MPDLPFEEMLLKELKEIKDALNELKNPKKEVVTYDASDVEYPHPPPFKLTYRVGGPA
jgi:hypothetical protein